jgi:hypothetical protein
MGMGYFSLPWANKIKKKLLQVSNLACQPYPRIFPLKLPLGQFPTKIPGPVSQTKFLKNYGGDAVLTKNRFWSIN